MSMIMHTKIKLILAELLINTLKPGGNYNKNLF
jgi:hypothetical protein